MMRAFALFVLLIAGPAVQAGSFFVPKGCTGYLTVQHKHCQVQHHWTCAAEAPGVKWHTEVGLEGPTYLGKVGDQAEWLDSFFIQTDQRETLITPAPDLANLDTLFADSLDTYKFSLNTAFGTLTVTGYDRIAERDLTIGAEVLHRTEYKLEVAAPNGQVIFTSEGSEYVSPTHRRFFAGYGVRVSNGVTQSFDEQPIKFIYPGQPGYLNNTPLYGCDVLNAHAVFQ